MLIALIMFFTWQTTDNPKYQPPFTKAMEASLVGSDAQKYVDSASEYAKKKSPLLSSVAPIGYATLVKKQVSFTSTKLLSGATTCSYDNKAHSAFISITWSF